MILAFLQNMWVKRPDEVRRLIARHGEEFRVRFMRRALFAGCKTGRNLRKAFGEELIEQIVFEETTREIAGDPKTIFPADLAHIKACLEHHQPKVVLTFGQIALDALLACRQGPNLGVASGSTLLHIHAHHPASRHPGSFQTLLLAAAEVRVHLAKN